MNKTHDLEIFMVLLGIVGYMLSIISYVQRVAMPNKSDIFVLGGILLTVGYSILFISRLTELREITDKEHAQLKNIVHKESTNHIEISGYIILFLFFASIHAIPALTERVRIYDMFAALGYFFATVAKLVPTIIPGFVPIILLIVYYLLGAFQKLMDWETNTINKIQFVSRCILVFYFGIHLCI